MGPTYHDGMPVPHRAPSIDHGRVNQKRRTRAAIVEAAKELLDQGVTPTVAQAAEAAQVSRTTAYRYFPSQDSLLVEVALNVDVDDIEQAVASEVDEAGAAERAVDVLDSFNAHVFDAEAQYRTALRLYLDVWLEAAGKGDETPGVREGRRRRWYEDSLAPLRDGVAPDAWDRLITALCVLSGPEPMTVLRDVSQLDDEDGRAVLRWAAATLIRATLDEAGVRPRAKRTTTRKGRR